MWFIGQRIRGVDLGGTPLKVCCASRIVDVTMKHYKASNCIFSELKRSHCSHFDDLLEFSSVDLMIQGSKWERWIDIGVARGYEMTILLKQMRYFCVMEILWNFVYERHVTR